MQEAKERIIRVRQLEAELNIALRALPKDIEVSIEYNEERQIGIRHPLPQLDIQLKKLL